MPEFCTAIQLFASPVIYTPKHVNLTEPSSMKKMSTLSSIRFRPGFFPKLPPYIPSDFNPQSDLWLVENEIRWWKWWMDSEVSNLDRSLRSVLQKDHMVYMCILSSPHGRYHFIWKINPARSKGYIIYIYTQCSAIFVFLNNNRACLQGLCHIQENVQHPAPDILTYSLLSYFQTFS